MSSPFISGSRELGDGYQFQIPAGKISIVEVADGDTIMWLIARPEACYTSLTVFREILTLKGTNRGSGSYHHISAFIRRALRAVDASGSGHAAAPVGQVRKA